MRKLVFMLSLLLCSLQLIAQNRTVTGKVTDEKDGSPLAGVSVTVKGTTTGTSTAVDGSFSLSVPASAKTLVFTYVNYQSLEVPIGNKAHFPIALTSTEKSLQEVVVTGYSREKKSQFTGSATVLSSKAVETVPVGAFDQALQGRAPGMLVNSGNGQPGNSANITIRGISSIQGAGVQPLFVIDGVPMPAADMQTINPNDFESITVLKDAGAAALYGARGGLGVIVITTKKGKSGQAQFTYRTQLGMTQPPSPNRFDMMNTAEALAYEEKVGVVLGGSITTPGYAYSKLNPSYATSSATEQARRDRLLDSFRNINSDFYKILFRQGISQTHELNMSGGNATTKYFWSGSYFDQKGTDMTSRLRRYTTRFNLDNTIGRLSMQFNTAAGFSITNINEGSWYGNSTRNPFQMVWRAKTYENPYRADGTVIYGSSTTTSPKVIGNLIEGTNNSSWIDKQIKINSGLTFAYKILPVLTVKNTFGIDVASEFDTRSINANSYVGSLQTYQSGYDAESFRIRAQLINTTAAIFSKKFSKNDLEVGAYFEAVRQYNKGLGFVLYNLDPRLNQTGQGAGTLATGGAATMTQNAASAKSGYGIRSYFATARYTYDSKYTATANIRRDGTSRILNDANKEITTWSAGFIWDAIKEDFMSSQNVLTDLKLRLSYGEVPNIGSITTSTYGISGGGVYTITNYLGPQLPTFSTTSGFAGSTITGIYPSAPGNPDLKLEYIQKSNIGIDVALWKSRARLTVDAYRNITKNLFVSQPLPASSGFSNSLTGTATGAYSLPINAGTMSNKGVEFTVSVDVVKTKDFDLTLGANHAINVNKIVDLGLVNEYPLGTFIIRKGLPYGSHYTQHYLGADPATGKPMYEKQDGTTTTNVNEAAYFAKFGTYLPKHVGGFTADFRIKRISISALFSYQFKVARSNNVENWTTRGTSGYINAVNANKKMLTEQWMKPGDVKFYQSPAYDRGFTSAEIQDAKFLRFRNLNISYQIPEFSVNGTRIIKSARFYIQGQNLFIWSPWRGLDPEDDNNISLQEYPNPRAIVAGIDINF